MEHHVYFWLKEEHQNEPDRRLFEAALDTLLAIPHATRALWGKPAATPARAVLDDTWDYALSQEFADLAAHDAYQSDPAHQAFLNQYRSWWEKVQIRDIE